MKLLLFDLLVFAIAWVLGYIAGGYYERRRWMDPEARKRADEELKRNMRIW